MGEGRDAGSFPKNNAANHSHNADHLMLISRQSGNDFNLTRTFMDIDLGKDNRRRFRIDNDSAKTLFTGAVP